MGRGVGRAELPNRNLSLRRTEAIMKTEYFETKHPVTGSITEIHYGLEPAALFNGDGWDGVDETASLAAYREELQKRLQQAFPTATIELLDVPSVRSWAHPNNAMPSDNQQWYETCQLIDEQLFQEPEEWLVLVAE